MTSLFTRDVVVINFLIINYKKLNNKYNNINSKILQFLSIVLYTSEFQKGFFN